MTENPVPFIAHVRQNPDGSFTTHDLLDHLKGTAALAGQFAKNFKAEEWACLAGLWHDLGKYSEEFQNMIRGKSGLDAHIETQAGRVDHSTAGAQHAFSQNTEAGKLLAYLIAGHHAGLANGAGNPLTERSCLAARLRNDGIPEWKSFSPDSILKQTMPSKLPFQLSDQGAIELSVFIRMLFSSLVDADFLDTEKFMDSEREKLRGGYPSLTELSLEFLKNLDRLQQSVPESEVNLVRGNVLADCLSAADKDAGFFSLTVPTGGGKTLSSMAFALKHALKHGLERVIYVIPYTSIIEQNADVFRKYFGIHSESVLEHHSNFDPRKETARSRIASENWDAPVIVTTNVQFFESLYANRPSACRKLHRLATSVIILDEAQMLPVELLRPCLESLRELVKHYGTSIVLCTATQPALLKEDEFPDGLEKKDVREIISDPVRLYSKLQRVRAEFVGKLSDDEIVKKMLACDQSLCILNLKEHAKELFFKIKDQPGAFHLSAGMCPAHRREVLSEIRDSLKSGRVCRVVSTQVVEAGVDLDFPVVLRAMAGLDSIAQAAGRCNREGRLSGYGQVIIFETEKIPRYVRIGTEETMGVIRRNGDSDILGLKAVHDFFQQYYWRRSDQLDAKRILDQLEQGRLNLDFPFKDIAQMFQMIPGRTVSVIVPWNKGAESLIQTLRYAPDGKVSTRLLQPYSVSVHLYGKEPEEKLAALPIEILHDRFHVLTDMNFYDKETGLNFEGQGVYIV
ncbi:MAG: hypothetical protein A2Y02_01190 [Omnitrophica bacterium GWA2_52_12]|nr:MAG: hypothetical protein A2Y02_01190 [Omnitrophica bacterium GWA2_52_12]